ncbi:MAG: 50S ribosomal protein L29 [Candidatus Magasanikbacteria bacterium CG10_big_fil_rev_8_21_14_0_10_47_10]|uniref:Large ribosomal subunit protein uL29 n=1 Tax=Candidatus Magasanikbacteria bacterium CG10_big_fil_rev_8_21_14_0_10_47_10 TaxID=1974652 RepID=A0A2H0TPB0_9BACT|nr:MAG: 50S ribosomal protein L29 [Candidatus Magasanikbacteria bacterium CG10_big_fil_rev_8_21_14_0_10_47_10]
MDIAELKKTNRGELQNLLAEKRDELRTLRFKASERQLKEVRRIRSVKQTIAQILTVLSNGEETTHASSVQTN